MTKPVAKKFTQIPFQRTDQTSVQKEFKQMAQSKRSAKNFQKLDEALSQCLKPIFEGGKKEFQIINNLTKNWSQIVGKQHAKSCKPKLINLQKNSQNHENSNQTHGILTIVAFDSATGFFLKNSSEAIIERIATFYGFKAMSKIIIKQEPKIIGDLQDSKKSEDLVKNLKPEARSQISEAVAALKDQELSKILSELGALIYGTKTQNLFSK